MKSDGRPADWALWHAKDWLGQRHGFGFAADAYIDCKEFLERFT